MSAIGELRAALDVEAVGRELYAAVATLWPLRRSLTGEGVRATIRTAAAGLPLEVHEVPSGTPVLDWTVPDEWNLRAARLHGPDGQVIIDAAARDLHVVGYSTPISTRLPLAELRPHLHTLPDRPELTPYRTAYYEPAWGFCLPHRIAEALPDGDYDVLIDADLSPGSLTYGEVVLPGEDDAEILLTAHTCHPQLANDNLSGIAVLTALGRLLAEVPRRHTVRLLLAPGTIGAITWLARNREHVGRIRHGLVLAGLGDGGPLAWKRTRAGDAPVDRAVALALSEAETPHELLPFTPWGYDERQYGSPGFALPVGRLSRTPHGTYPEYHTSADDLDFVQPHALAESLVTLLRVHEVLDGDGVYRNLVPHGEPQLGRRGLYSGIGGKDADAQRLALLWVLSLSDGTHSLLDVAERSGLPFAVVRAAADRLLDAELLSREGPA